MGERLHYLIDLEWHPVLKPTSFLNPGTARFLIKNCWEGKY